MVKRLFAIAGLLISAAAPSFAGSPDAVTEEAIFNDVISRVTGRISMNMNTYAGYACNKGRSTCLSAIEIAIQAIDEAAADPAYTSSALEATRQLREKAPSLGDQLQIYALYRSLGGDRDKEWEKKLRTRVSLTQIYTRLSAKSSYVIASYPEVFTGEDWADIMEQVNKKSADQMQAFAVTPSVPARVMRDLISADVNVEKYDNGLFADRPRLYMFCRESREYPCLMLMRNADGSLRMTEDKKIPWSQPALALSSRRRAYNQTNGNTPMGVYRIDGVMPEANLQQSFGQFRRLILNFIPASKNEKTTKMLLPFSSSYRSWWKQAVVARDVGRGLLRIHGTGHESAAGTTYFPFVPTSGCIAKRENTYDKITYIDQRELLDELMLASGLEPKYANETEILGLLYLINIDSTKSAVSLADLKKLGVY